MTAAVSRAANASARFSARMALARTCLDAGQPALARAIYDGLDADQKHHDLEEWDPSLVARCLEGLLLSLRALAKNGKATAQDVAMVYDRLCRLEPAAALRLGG
jgi:hypothetical protein